MFYGIFPWWNVWTMRGDVFWSSGLRHYMVLVVVYRRFGVGLFLELQILLP